MVEAFALNSVQKLKDTHSFRIAVPRWPPKADRISSMDACVKLAGLSTTQPPGAP